jgi:alpha-1,6-fucosyltransferase-like protein
MVIDLESGQQGQTVFPREPRGWHNIYYPFLRKHRSFHNIYQALGWSWMLLIWQVGYRFRRRVRSVLPAAGRAAAAKFLVIRMNHHGAGFFAYFTFALNQLKYAERHGLQPVVDFGYDSGTGPNPYFDADHGDNLWDYFFEPVDGPTYREVREMLADPDNPTAPEDLTSLSSEDLWFMHQHDPQSLFGYPYGFYRYKLRYDAEWFEKNRREANRLIRKYVRLKPNVSDEVNSFVDRHMAGHPVVGVHARGTDKGEAGCMPALRDIVPPEEYIPEIDAYLRDHPGGRIFVATDQRQYIEFFREHYGDIVLFYDSLRSSDHRAPFQLETAGNYRKGWDVLIDALLLSRCDFLLKCSSHVGETALWFNPDLASIDMNYKLLEGR